MGNYHAQFLGDLGLVTAPGYPTTSAAVCLEFLYPLKVVKTNQKGQPFQCIKRFRLGAVFGSTLDLILFPVARHLPL